MTLRLLVFTNLFPNAIQKNHGIFVLERLRHLRAFKNIEAQVVAPIPYFPRIPGFGRWSELARVPEQENVDGFPVYHPRYLVTPKFGMTRYPQWMVQGCRSVVRKILRSGIDVIDAHYAYPDGVAAIRLAEEFQVPVVLTARGSDINLIPRFSGPRAQIIETLQRADGLAAVCQALADEMKALASVDDVRVLRNGVDLQKFRPVDRQEARKRLQMGEGRWIVSVGQLIERKGHHLLIEAIAKLHKQGMTDLRASILGEGPERKRLQRLIDSHQLEHAVRLLGSKPHEELAQYYGAADVSVLASSREGWANVLLESMACGTPALATRIWGTPEVLSSPDCGLLIEERSAPAIASALKQALGQSWDRSQVRAHAEAHDWESTSQAQWEQFAEILSRRGTRLDPELRPSGG